MFNKLAPFLLFWTERKWIKWWGLVSLRVKNTLSPMGNAVWWELKQTNFGFLNNISRIWQELRFFIPSFDYLIIIRFSTKPWFGPHNQNFTFQRMKSLWFEKISNLTMTWAPDSNLTLQKSATILSRKVEQIIELRGFRVINLICIIERHIETVVFEITDFE